eukprot:jgi/Ulvmu1/1218/UM109_0016.1
MGQQRILGVSPVSDAGGTSLAPMEKLLKAGRHSKAADTGSDVRKRDRQSAELDDELGHAKACRSSMSSAQTNQSGALKAAVPKETAAEAKLQKTVANIKKNLVKSVRSQMVYIKGMKHSRGGKRFSAIVPNVDESLAVAVFGKENWKCTAKTKQVRSKTADLHVDSKPLRYSASLCVDELTLEWKRECGTMRAYGKYSMQ